MSQTTKTEVAQYTCDANKYGWLYEIRASVVKACLKCSFQQFELTFSISFMKKIDLLSFSQSISLLHVHFNYNAILCARFPGQNKLMWVFNQNNDDKKVNIILL